MFPSGVVSRKNKGKIKIYNGIKVLLQRLLPVKESCTDFFDAKNSNLFYWEVAVCKRLKIKFNIEMLYCLVNYSNRKRNFYHKNRKPISWKTFDNTKTGKNGQERLNIVYNL